MEASRFATATGTKKPQPNVRGILMGLKESAARVPVARAGGYCRVGQFLGMLDRDEASLLREWLQDTEGRSGEWISRVIRDAYDQNVSGQTIQRHRRGVCLCPQN